MEIRFTIEEIYYKSIKLLKLRTLKCAYAHSKFNILFSDRHVSFLLIFPNLLLHGFQFFLNRYPCLLPNLLLCLSLILRLIQGSLNEEGRNKVLSYISDLEDSGNYRQAEIIPLHVIRERKVFYNTVSAGTGTFLDGDEYEMYSSPDIPEAATFGVYVDGDSMEPKYHNKDLIWIEQTQMLEDGEIGIFYLDGNAYVKKFQNNRLGTYLISLNKKYNPIPVTENSTFKIFGRVLS